MTDNKIELEVVSTGNDYIVAYRHTRFPDGRLAKNTHDALRYSREQFVHHYAQWVNNPERYNMSNETLAAYRKAAFEEWKLVVINPQDEDGDPMSIVGEALKELLDADYQPQAGPTNIFGDMHPSDYRDFERSVSNDEPKNHRIHFNYNDDKVLTIKNGDTIVLTIPMPADGDGTDAVQLANDLIEFLNHR